LSRSIVEKSYGLLKPFPKSLCVIGRYLALLCSEYYEYCKLIANSEVYTKMHQSPAVGAVKKAVDDAIAGK